MKKASKKRPHEKKHQQDDESEKIERMAARREDNYGRKKEMMEDVETDNIYELAMSPTVAASRKDIAISEIVTLATPAREFKTAEAAKRVADKLRTPGPPPPPATKDSIVERASRETGAKRIVAPKGVPIQNMMSFVENNLPALALAKQRQAESPLNPPTLLPAPTPPPPPPVARVSLPIGKRSSTMAHGDAALPPVEKLPPLPLPPGDPAANTLDRIDLVTAMVVPFLDQAYRYHELKARYAPRQKHQDVYEMSPEHVAWSHSKFFSPYRACMFGSFCEGFNPLSKHSNGEQFPFVQFVPPRVRRYVEETGKLPIPKPGDSPNDYLALDDSGEPIPTPCLRCHTKIMLYLCYLNIGEDQTSKKVFIEFFHPVGRIGAYCPSAVVTFSDGRINSLTSTVRYFAPEQFVPCTREVISVRRELDGRSKLVKIVVPGYEEKDEVKFFSTARTMQRRALEGDPRATAPSAVPPAPPMRQVEALVPSVYPLTSVVSGPTSDAQILRSSVLGDQKDPKIKLGAPISTDSSPVKQSFRSPSLPVPGAYDDWNRAVDVENEIASHMRALTSSSQPKNAQARRLLPSPSRAEGGDAHIIKSGVPFFALREGIPIDRVEVPADPARVLLDLTFRDLGDAYRLAVLWKWKPSEQPYPRFDLGQEPLLSGDLSNLLEHIVCVRVNVCLELEEILFRGIGARREWLFARSLAAPGASAPGNGGIKKRRKKGAEPAMKVASDVTLLPEGFSADLVSKLSNSAREQIGAQVVYWRDRHARIIERLWNDEEDLVPREYLSAVRKDPLVLGLERPPFAEMFEDPARPMPPVFERDFEAVRTKTELRCHETPLSFLRDRLRKDDLHKVLLESVLVDFRQTIDFLVERGPELAIPHNHWMPRTYEDTDGSFIEKGIHAEDRTNWTEKMCEHVRRKDQTNKGVLRAETLKEECDARTEAIASAFVKQKKTTSDDAKRDEVFRRAVRKGWQAKPLGTDAKNNYLILVATVYRVNMALEEMERERRILEDLGLVELDASPHPPTEEADEEEERSDMRPRTNEEDDADLLKGFRRQYERISARMERTAEERKPKNGREGQKRLRIEESLDIMHRWKRFAFSHLQMAQILVDASRCDDEFLLEEDLPAGRLSHYMLSYPFPENGWGEEVLQNVRYRAHLVDIVHGLGGNGSLPARPTAIAKQQQGDAPKSRSNRGEADNAREMDAEAVGLGESNGDTNQWISLLKKIFPKACSERDFAPKCDEICRTNVRCFHYVLECFLATLCGLYRHSRNPVRFSLALSLYRMHELCRTKEVHRNVMLDVFFSNEEIVINSLRENVSWQLADDANLWMLNADWVKGSTHFIRTLFQAQGNLVGIQSALLRGYGSHGLLAGTKSLPASMAMSVGDAVSVSSPSLGKASVYRTGNKNFVVRRFHSSFFPR